MLASTRQGRRLLACYSLNVVKVEFCELHLEGSSYVVVCPGRSWKITRATLRGVRLRSILLTSQRGIGRTGFYLLEEQALPPA
jgi:hypothetical protein